MEGPTPVSALIHAATMVTAGVYLLIRCSFIFEYAPNILLFICFIGGLTAIYSSLIAILQYDIKKIIAYSTCSQLGYMIFTCGLSNYNLAFFHLCNHAFFKALLFLSAGAIIHGLSNEQDIRKMGGLIKFFPITYVTFLIGSFSLMGFPFLSGFYSKDLILEFSYIQFKIFHRFFYLLNLITAFFTAFYSTRLIYYVFLTKPNGFKSIYKTNFEVNPIISLIFIILSLGSCIFGFFFSDLFIGIGSNFFSDSIFILPKNITLLESEFIPV
jgi:NADH-ubiquinone oxidoreductase chain 5